MNRINLDQRCPNGYGVTDTCPIPDEDNEAGGYISGNGFGGHYWHHVFAESGANYHDNTSTGVGPVAYSPNRGNGYSYNEAWSILR